MRDYEAFKKSRLDLLTLRPTLRASWIGFAVANHLLGEHDTAFDVLEEFRTVSGDFPNCSYIIFNKSNLQLYDYKLYKSCNYYMIMTNLNKDF